MTADKKFDAVIFDMDGVLIDAKEWHYSALNSALDLFGLGISLEDHLSYFDGLPTKTKLNRISELHHLPPQLHPLINDVKQERTMRLAAQFCYPKPNLLTIFSYLKNENYKIGLATNSIRKTTEAMMRYSGLLDYFDVIVTNEDVTSPKPSPQIYLSACEMLEVVPSNVLVFEDNHHGIEAAREAGCRVSVVKEPDLLFLDDVLRELEI
jgi:beta-phosphoglucomutase-like phosphatase (HAD superfamily)